MAPSRLALLSVTDKTGLVPFARRVAACGYRLISTGGTARVLREQGLEVSDISDLTGFPEMLDGRVKTLHPRVHGALLGIRGNPEHERQMRQHGIQPISLVVVNLYAFEKTAARPGVAFDEVVENIDIGGPSMIRSAAKNFRSVAVVTSPADYDVVAGELESAGEVSAPTRWRLAQAAFALTAAYDTAIAGTLAHASLHDGEISLPAAGNERFPAVLRLNYRRLHTLRYGENPHQRAAVYAAVGAAGGIANAEPLQGKELSYNNLVDLEACWELVHEFDRPAVAIVKHTNPAGCATAGSLADAYRKALACDPVSAFGGVIGLNRELDAEAAEEISKLFVECIAAPAYSAAALNVLSAKKNLRLVRVEPEMAAADPAGVALRSISGGLLVQDRDVATLDPAALRTVTQRAPSDEEMRALLFAWKVCKHVKSNAIVFAREGQVLAVGAGQMSRVDSVRLAAMKAQLPLAGSVLASDAFFPFPDGVEEAAKHGITAVIQPGGSVRDADVIAACDRARLAMVFTGMRHFRH
jgi:phosphoribosylaminoimidazolecarboxamide formyltransferase/IMP cyclohydrolase